ncbi:MAG: PEGA domain-containing protein [Myxococcota bacterium]
MPRRNWARAASRRIGVTGLGSLLVWTSVGTGCAGRRPPPPTGPPVTIVVQADEGLEPELRQVLEDSELPVELRFAELPPLPAVAVPRLGFEDRLATARARYIEADFEGCQQALVGESLETTLLGDNRRTTVSRLLLWRLACYVGAAQTERAERVAEHFAVYDLEIPSDVEAVTPEVEAVLGRAMVTVSQRAPATLALQTEPSRATVSVDGRPSSCTSPCDLDLPAGDHVVRVHATGSQPLVQRIKVPATGTTETLTLTPAPPVEVARQWSTRYAGSPAIDSAHSVRLLARAVRAQRLLLVTAEGDQGVELRGVLAIDDRIAARTERQAAHEELPTVAPALLEDLLVQGEVLAPPKPLVRRWGFWLAIGLTAAGAAGITAIVLQQPPPRTEVQFQ